MISQTTREKILQFHRQNLSLNRITRNINDKLKIPITTDEVWEIIKDVEAPAERFNSQEFKALPDENKTVTKKEVEEFIAQLNAKLAETNKLLSKNKTVTKKSVAAISKNQKGKHISLTVAISDLHAGKKLTITQEDGTNKIVFNTEILKKRILSLVPTVVGYIQRKRKEGFIIDELIFPLLGDLADGEIIWKGQHARIDMPAVFQHTDVSSTLWEMAKQISALEPKLPILFKCVPGNHGRVSNSPASAQASNWDNVIYQSLKMFSLVDKTNKTIDVDFALDEPFNYEIKDWKFQLRHKGIKESPVTSSARAMIGSWYAIHHFDVIMWGHLHDCFYSMWQQVHCFQNGSISESDDYAEKLGKVSFPAFWVFTTTKEKPVQDIAKIDFIGTTSRI